MGSACPYATAGVPAGAGSASPRRTAADRPSLLAEPRTPTHRATRRPRKSATRARHLATATPAHSASESQRPQGVRSGKPRVLLRATGRQGVTRTDGVRPERRPRPGAAPADRSPASTTRPSFPRTAPTPEGAMAERSPGLPSMGSLLRRLRLHPRRRGAKMRQGPRRRVRRRSRCQLERRVPCRSTSRRESRRQGSSARRPPRLLASWPTPSWQRASKLPPSWPASPRPAARLGSGPHARPCGGPGRRTHRRATTSGSSPRNRARCRDRCTPCWSDRALSRARRHAALPRRSVRCQFGSRAPFSGAVPGRVRPGLRPSIQARISPGIEPHASHGWFDAPVHRLHTTRGEQRDRVGCR